MFSSLATEKKRKKGGQLPHEEKKIFLEARQVCDNTLCFHGVDLGLGLGYGCDILRVRVRRLGASICRAPHPTKLPSYCVRWREGDQAALDSLMPLVYEELRRVAHNYLQRERLDHTLQSTAVVHEAYLRLVEGAVEFQNREHFFAVSAQLMRQILVDYARKHRSLKRDGGYKLAHRGSLEDFRRRTLTSSISMMPSKSFPGWMLGKVAS